MHRRLFLVFCVVLIFPCLPPGFCLAQNGQNETAEEQPIPRTLEGTKELIEKGRYAEAEELTRELLKETEEEYGKESLEVAGVLNVLVESLSKGGEVQNSEFRRLALRVINLKEKVLGHEHPEVARSLTNYSLLLKSIGDYDKAIPLLKQALLIWERAYKQDHPDVAAGCAN